MNHLEHAVRLYCALIESGSMVSPATLWSWGSVQEAIQHDQDLLIDLGRLDERDRERVLRYTGAFSPLESLGSLYVFPSVEAAEGFVRCVEAGGGTAEPYADTIIHAYGDDMDMMNLEAAERGGSEWRGANIHDSVQAIDAELLYDMHAEGIPAATLRECVLRAVRAPLGMLDEGAEIAGKGVESKFEGRLRHFYTPREFAGVPAHVTEALRLGGFLSDRMYGTLVEQEPEGKQAVSSAPRDQGGAADVEPDQMQGGAATSQSAPAEKPDTPTEHVPTKEEGAPDGDVTLPDGTVVPQEVLKDAFVKFLDRIKNRLQAGGGMGQPDARDTEDGGAEKREQPQAQAQQQPMAQQQKKAQQAPAQAAPQQAAPQQAAVQQKKESVMEGMFSIQLIFDNAGAGKRFAAALERSSVRFAAGVKMGSTPSDVVDVYLAPYHPTVRADVIALARSMGGDVWESRVQEAIGKPAALTEAFIPRVGQKVYVAHPDAVDSAVVVEHGTGGYRYKSGWAARNPNPVVIRFTSGLDKGSEMAVGAGHLYTDPMAATIASAELARLAAEESVQEQSRYAITGSGLRPITGDEILLQPDHIYFMGASSSPSMIIVTSVGNDRITYRQYPWRKDIGMEKWVASDLISQGTATWLKSSYSRYDPALKKALEGLLAGKRSPLKHDPTDYQRIDVTVEAGRGYEDKDLWRDAEEYGNVGGEMQKDPQAPGGWKPYDTPRYVITMDRRDLSKLKGDRRFVVLKVAEAKTLESVSGVPNTLGEASVGGFERHPVLGPLVPGHLEFDAKFKSKGGWGDQGFYLPDPKVLGSREAGRQKDIIDGIGKRLYGEQYWSEYAGRDEKLHVGYRDNRDKDAYIQRMEELGKAVKAALPGTSMSRSGNAGLPSFYITLDKRRIAAVVKAHPEWVEMVKAVREQMGLGEYVETYIPVVLPRGVPHVRRPVVEGAEGRIVGVEGSRIVVDTMGRRVKCSPDRVLVLAEGYDTDHAVFDIAAGADVMEVARRRVNSHLGVRLDNVDEVVRAIKTAGASVQQKKRRKSEDQREGVVARRVVTGRDGGRRPVVEMYPGVQAGLVPYLVRYMVGGRLQKPIVNFYPLSLRVAEQKAQAFLDRNVPGAQLVGLRELTQEEWERVRGGHGSPSEAVGDVVTAGRRLLEELDTGEGAEREAAAKGFADAATRLKELRAAAFSLTTDDLVRLTSLMQALGNKGAASKVDQLRTTLTGLGDLVKKAGDELKKAHGAAGVGSIPGEQQATAQQPPAQQPPAQQPPAQQAPQQAPKQPAQQVPAQQPPVQAPAESVQEAAGSEFKKAKWVATNRGPFRQGQVVWVMTEGERVWVAEDPNTRRGIYATPYDVEMLERDYRDGDADRILETAIRRVLASDIPSRIRDGDDYSEVAANIRAECADLGLTLGQVADVHRVARHGNMTEFTVSVDSAAHAAMAAADDHIVGLLLADTDDGLVARVPGALLMEVASVLRKGTDTDQWRVAGMLDGVLAR